MSAASRLLALGNNNKNRGLILRNPSFSKNKEIDNVNINSLPIIPRNDSLIKTTENDPEVCIFDSDNDTMLCKKIPEKHIPIEIMSVIDDVCKNDENCAENKLNKMGFETTKRIIVDKRGNLLAYYLETKVNIDNKNEKFYIQLDVDDTDVIGNKQDIVVRKSKNNNIPTSFKNGMYKTVVNQGASGVIIECDNGMCSITRTDNEFEPKEKFFEIENLDKKINQDNIVDNFRSYCVIRLSDILRQNSEEIKNIVRICSQQICSVNDNHCKESLKMLQKLLIETQNLVGKIMTNNNKDAHYKCQRFIKPLAEINARLDAVSSNF